MGHRTLNQKWATKIIHRLLLKGAAADELLAAVRQSAVDRQPLERSVAAEDFGRFLISLGQQRGLSKPDLAVKFGMRLPNLLDIEKGRTVPSPLLASRLAFRLKLSPGEAATYFRHLGEALRKNSPVAKSTSTPELCSLNEWLVFARDPAITAPVSVASEVYDLPNAKKAIPAVNRALAALRRQFGAQVRNRSSYPAPPINAWCRHPDGKVTLFLAVGVTF
jgi:transcriptional regulator with XRE-family HTH domain